MNIDKIIASLQESGHSDLAEEVQAFKKAKNPFEEAEIGGITVTDEELEKAMPNLLDYIPRVSRGGTTKPKKKAKKPAKKKLSKKAPAKKKAAPKKKPAKKKAKASTVGTSTK